MTVPFIHSQALVESKQIGDGTRVWAFAHVMHGATIGRDCNVGGHAFVESGAVIGNNVTIKNHVCVWDGVTIEDEAFVGPHATFTNDLFPMSSLRRGDRAFTVSGTRLATIAPPKHVAGRMRNNFELRSLASRIVTFPRL